VLVYLRLAPEHALDRIRARGLATNLFEREDDLRRTSEIFERVTAPVALCIDGLLPPAEIHERVVAFVLAGPLAGRLA
jgi:thymidylate kinase